MKRNWIIVALIVANTIPVLAQAPSKPAEVPRNKWFSGRKGYEEAKVIQDQTGANMFIYFANYGIQDEKGLCNWWEKAGLNDGKVNKFLRDYIKVKVELPFSNRDEELFKSFRVNKTPAVFIVAPGSRYPARCNVFNWENNRPRPKEADELIKMFGEASATPEKPAETTD
jgi:hypothetical protein